MKFSKERVEFFVPIFNSLFAAIAVCIGGYWTYHQYELSGADSWSIILSIDTEVLPYKDNLRLLFVRVKSKNPRAYEHKLLSKKGDSFKLYFREIPTNGQSGSIINEDKIAPLKVEDLMSDSGGEYSFSPGSELSDAKLIVVPVDALISITAEMVTDGGSKSGGDFISSSAIVKIPSK